MKTEKVSVNLSPVELGQIDCLVERGLFDNRSDFIRAAARKSLEDYTEDIRQFLEPKNLENESTGLTFIFGIGALSKDEIKNYIQKNKKIHIRVIGMFSISKNVTPEEIKQVVQSCRVHGVLIASEEVSAALKEIAENDN